MNGLQFNVRQETGNIRMNFDSLVTQLNSTLQEYEGAVFTEESKTIARGEVAKLRKLKTAIDDRRKEVKKACMQPYEDFEKQVKTLLELIDKPILLINKQIDEMEEKRIREKREEIQKIYESLIQDMGEYLPLKRIYEKKWENIGTSIKAIQSDIASAVSGTKEDVATIKAMQSDAVDTALTLYKKSLSMTEAISHINSYERQKAEILIMEAKKREEEVERRHQQEEERIRKEERRRIAEEARIREDAHREEQQRIQKEKMEEVTGFFATDEPDELPFTQPTTIVTFYKIVATEEELERVEMAFNSIGIYYERNVG